MICNWLMTVCLPVNSFMSTVMSPVSINSTCRRDNCTRISSTCCLAVTRAASCSVFVVDDDMRFSLLWPLQRSQPVEQLHPILPTHARRAHKIGVRPNPLQNDPCLFQRATGFAHPSHPAMAACDLDVRFQGFGIV